jgi:hypothetical protein
VTRSTVATPARAARTTTATEWLRTFMGRPT